ncbi:hypothetical protein [Gordonia crocea]|uniref:Lipoprotein n=1 Tax=Gordonia crocea TaxID=589162 RepID=A0A7M3SVC1_9ACTN|nr:hypothetical protein [Gordonia crocea]GED96595.1 hypothetical protein nbrc107697_06340 [Gordonia crocea]
MTEKRRRGACLAAVLAAVAAGAVVTGCGSDEAANYQSQLSSVQAKQATAESNEKFATEIVQGDQHLNNVAGAARMAEFDALAAKMCPGSTAAKRLAKLKSDGKVEGFGYFPAKKTEIVGAWTEKDPNNVMVVATNRFPEDSQAKKSTMAIRVSLGADGGRTCAQDMTRQ